jgi:hypothetical protein
VKREKKKGIGAERNENKEKQNRLSIFRNCNWQMIFNMLLLGNENRM